MEAGLNSAGENEECRDIAGAGTETSGRIRMCIRLRKETTRGGRVSDKEAEDEERIQGV